MYVMNLKLKDVDLHGCVYASQRRIGHRLVLEMGFVLEIEIEME